jgi:AraC-like DNA-binding protein/mannose-6-phosphate isomerase-like protein (cupin superfamily)
VIVVDIHHEPLHHMHMPEDSIVVYVRRLPAETDAMEWGLCVEDCGFSYVRPGTRYPPPYVDVRPGVRYQSPYAERPAEDLLSWERGRTLQEYQLVYITEGRGTFESEPTGRVRIEAGQAFLLFPGVWHRYRPVKSVGWEEHWVRFKGEAADRIMGSSFSPESAVIRVGFRQELRDLIQSIAGAMKEAQPGHLQVAGARTMEALALVRMYAMTYRKLDRDAGRKIQRASQHLVKHCCEPIDMEALAKRLGLSYSNFRSLFKRHTGVPPHNFLIDVRLDLARHWLIDSNRPIGEIADIIGFSSVYYFSRLFKKRIGCPPSAYRQRREDARSAVT